MKTPARGPFCLLILALFILAPLRTALAEELILSGGGRIEGKVIKRTSDTVFVDIGYTILPVPAKEVMKIESSSEGNQMTSRDTGDSTGPGKGGERRHGIYSTGRLEPGPIDEKARQVAEGVVQVLCPSKTGSGFILHEEKGYVVTNAHVVEGDLNIAVMIYIRQGNEMRKVRLEEVRIVALNPFYDLALLKLEKTKEHESLKFRKVYLGDSDAVRMGDPVFAVGSPLGLERTVTEGIVSNARRVRGGLIYIQTSAPINPGNSGGPLFNNRGEVVGITSQKAFGESLGFAIPVNYLKDFLANREAFSFDKENANNGIRYLRPPRKKPPEGQEF